MESNRIEYKREEHLGSGIPRILEAYGKEAFQISRNFMRLVFPYAYSLPQPESRSESKPESLETRILKILIEDNKSKKEISEILGQKQISGQLNIVINRLISTQMIEYTIPDKPNSRLQKYRITGLTVLKIGGF